MHIEAFREYCLAKKGVTESFPFDRETLCYKVMGKLFALTDVDRFESVNLKCDPEKLISLRERYPAVGPGYHMNKKHWMTVLMDGSLADSLIMEWIDHSYELVVAGLTRKQKSDLDEL
ncbi:MAG: MmcQ/YjbR family DNA-binding protein [Bacteroidia bacterium]|nr:MAG: MmcQ/YjbR family DNA-binding protein [Bacteroidia bacterium]